MKRAAALAALLLTACSEHPAIEEIPAIENCMFTGTTIATGSALELGTGGPDAFVPLADGAELEAWLSPGIEKALLAEHSFVFLVSARIPNVVTGPDLACGGPFVTLSRARADGTFESVGRSDGFGSVVLHRVGADYVSGPFPVTTPADPTLLGQPIKFDDGRVDIDLPAGILRATLTTFPTVLAVNRSGFLASR